MAQSVDFPIYYIRADRVDSTKPKDWIYASCLSNTAVNGYFPDWSTARAQLTNLLAANIESAYKSAVAYPAVYPTATANLGVKNGGLVFVSAFATTAAVTVVAVTAATAVVSAAAVSATSAVTITISDTAANNSASAIVAAVNASTAAGTGAANYLTAYLWNGASHLPKPWESVNDGTGLVAAFAAVSLTQGNTLGGATARDKIIKASIGY